MKKIRIAINGFCRIRRGFFRNAFKNPYLEICAINDIADVKILSHLLKYDSIYGMIDLPGDLSRILRAYSY